MSAYLRHSPTIGQVRALGLLIINYRVWYGSNFLTYEDGLELVSMHLCHLVRGQLNLPLYYAVSSRLLREWMPYSKISTTWHDCLKYSHDGQTVVDIMDHLVLEAGQGLARNWQRWKMEDK